MIGYLLKRTIDIITNEGFNTLITKLIKNLYILKAYVTIEGKCTNTDIQSTIEYIFRGNHGLIKPDQIKQEMYDLINYIKNRKLKNILEIGTSSGGNLFVLTRLS